jgi:hypothetical protein
MDVVTGGFYLGTCSQEKVFRHDMMDVSPDMMESFFICICQNRHRNLQVSPKNAELTQIIV